MAYDSPTSCKHYTSHSQHNGRGGSRFVVLPATAPAVVSHVNSRLWPRNNHVDKAVNKYTATSSEQWATRSSLGRMIFQTFTEKVERVPPNSRRTDRSNGTDESRTENQNHRSRKKRTKTRTVTSVTVVVVGNGSNSKRRHERSLSSPLAAHANGSCNKLSARTDAERIVSGRKTNLAETVLVTNHHSSQRVRRLPRFLAGKPVSYNTQKSY